MGVYETDLALLGNELAKSLELFGSLSPADWTRSTALSPFDGAQARWTVFELGSHYDYFMSLTMALIDGPEEQRATRDAVSYYIYPRAEVAPVIYDLAYSRAEGKTATDLVSTMADTVATAMDQAHSTAPETIGPSPFGPIRLGDFITTRLLEAVVHGLDLTTALGSGCHATPTAITRTAAVLDELLTRRTVHPRPLDLDDDLAWVRAATGRAPHTDPRLPLIG